MVRILVDGDACPIIENIIDLGRQYGLKVFIFCSICHYSTSAPEMVYVDDAPEHVDMEISNRIQKKGDIVVTNDYGLAAISLGRGASVITYKGHIIDENNIDQILFRRFLSSKVRRAGGKVKGPKKFRKEDLDRFLKSILILINNN